MALTFEQYKQAIKSGFYKQVAKIDFLRLEDETVKQTIIGEIIGGSLSIKRGNGSRRSVTVELQNIDREFEPNKDGNIWANSKFRLSLGISVNGEDRFFPQGVFVTKNPTVGSFPKGSTITLSGVDKFSLFSGELGGTLDATYIVPNGSDINDAIRTIFSLYLDPNSQIPADPLVPILQSLSGGQATIPYEVTEELGGNLGGILEHFWRYNSRNMFYNESGRLVYENDENDSLKASLWDFTTGEVNYLGASYSYEFENLRNKIIVVGDNINGVIVRGEAVNDNPQSPTSVNRIGVKIETVTDSVIDNNTDATAYAEYLLKRKTVLQNAISLSVTPMFHLDVDQVITITDERLGLEEKRFLIESISIPLIPFQNMTISAVDTDELLGVS